ncbi:Smr/MutS family protein [Holophaga foetida]|uniref:Smr/MutS family protein n=1 Tax=Holophaga foetida TaxID=35839 RepID=UPI0002474FFD|nr:Smr/MutS family protein [Holophaga foetida]
MAWKQSLAKIKQDLKAIEGEPPKASPPPKVAPKKPEEVKPMEEEDALFLMAMGAKSQAKTPRKAPVVASPNPVAAPPEKPRDEDFGEAMASLKGMKGIGRSEVVEKAERKEEPAPEVLAVQAAPPVPEPPPAPPEPVAAPPVPLESEAAPPAPRRIHLAAGMAIEVDGAIDLRGHSIADARERLKERVLDSVCLGWRTLHVTLGDTEERREAFLDFLTTVGPRTIERYAQAPIPMGGASAWILYLGKP